MEQKTAPSRLLTCGVYLLDRACDISMRSVKLLAKEVGIRDGKDVLAMMAAEGHLNQKEIGALLQISNNCMVTRIDALEKKGYVKRIRNEQNRREILVKTTVRGEAVLEKIRLRHRTNINILDDTEYTELKRLLAKIVSQ